MLWASAPSRLCASGFSSYQPCFTSAMWGRWVCAFSPALLLGILQEQGRRRHDGIIYDCLFLGRSLTTTSLATTRSIPSNVCFYASLHTALDRVFSSIVWTKNQINVILLHKTLPLLRRHRDCNSHRDPTMTSTPVPSLARWVPSLPPTPTSPMLRSARAWRGIGIPIQPARSA